jgi:nucleoside-diphosphate-sugar epimerase
MGKSKVLVCGATGFIGRNVVERLSRRNDLEVYGTYFKTAPSSSLANIKGLTLVRVDLTSKDEVDSVVRGIDVVIQAAAVTSGSKDIVTKPYIHVTDNAIMNSLVFRACFESGVKHVVFFSCAVMYPNQEQPAKEEDFNHQIMDKYFGAGWTKVYIEKMCEFYSRVGNTKYTAIRHSNIYGPYDKFDLERSHVFGGTIAKVMNAKDGKVLVWGDGSEKRDLLYVADLVDFVEVIMESQRGSFELINVGYASSISIKHLVKKIIEISGRQLAIEFDMTKPTIKFNVTLNTDKARTGYKWEPRISLEDGIRKTLSWYKESVFLG